MSKFNPMLLIAMPQLLDPNFKKSVILILDQDPQGAFGLVINDSMNLKLGEFCQEQGMDLHPSLKDQAIFSGGPVEPYRGWLLHGNKELEEKQELIPGVYISNSKESLQHCLTQALTPFRFVLGYAGWGEGQFKQELEDGSWITAPVESKYVFAEDSKQLWGQILADMGVNPTSLAPGMGMH